ncbi:uncharacterized protein A4U43_C08F15280 [Asparagus officinalis]|nr:uncharacterized protein A4U43_C08F15280 [Asparagus officinalis]
MGIGGGWQLAWVQEKEGGLKRIYLHEGIPSSRKGSILSIPGGDVPKETDFVQAAALVVEVSTSPSATSKSLAELFR